MLLLSPQLEEAIRILAETRAELREMPGDEYVEPLPSANPIEDAKRRLTESRAMLDDLLADEQPLDGDDDYAPGLIR